MAFWWLHDLAVEVFWTQILEDFECELKQYAFRRALNDAYQYQLLKGVNGYEQAVQFAARIEQSIQKRKEKKTPIETKNKKQKNYKTITKKTKFYSFALKPQCSGGCKLGD